ncbi:hypothetical protein [Bradyrhizobium guangzhouense]|uniref:hypothetical protein n=1 Tax=Bradyrhizobium guangzhouense TaxID=1325095 RepID=UPI0010098FA5|nr:hypothetical protein [Bradyrhizobium guangzhouense]RXH15146.1 hypothetical protein EAS54_18835 [Bradyrhizobium guangzhouense]
MEDQRSLLERAKFVSESYGRPDPSGDDFADGFILQHRDNRVAILDALHAEESAGGEIKFEDMRKAADRAELIGRLKDTHQKLLKVGR